MWTETVYSICPRNLHRHKIIKDDWIGQGALIIMLVPDEMVIDREIIASYFRNIKLPTAGCSRLYSVEGLIAGYRYRLHPKFAGRYMMKHYHCDSLQSQKAQWWTFSNARCSRRIIFLNQRLVHCR